MRLIDADKVLERLKEVSYERYENDGMGGELVVNLDDVVDIMKGGGTDVNVPEKDHAEETADQASAEHPSGGSSGRMLPL